MTTLKKMRMLACVKKSIVLQNPNTRVFQSIYQNILSNSGCKTMISEYNSSTGTIGKIMNVFFMSESKL